MRFPSATSLDSTCGRATAKRIWLKYDHYEIMNKIKREKLTQRVAVGKDEE